MKVFRFMSKREFDKYMNGEELVNHTFHETNANTNSVGFCFMKVDDFSPEEASHFLIGVVDPDVCAVFETEADLEETYGVYAKPLRKETLEELLKKWRESFKVKEYCTESYNKDTFHLVEYSTDWLISYVLGKEWTWLKNE